MIDALFILLFALIAAAFAVLHGMQRKRNRYLYGLLNDERAARIAADSLTASVALAVEPILQKTAWSMGELAHYTVRSEEVRRNEIVDRVRRDLRKFNLPDATKGGSYGDLAHLNPTKFANRPYAEGTS